MGDPTAGEGVVRIRESAGRAAIPYAGGAAAGVLAGILGAHLGSLAGSVSVHLAQGGSPGWGALASSSIFAVVIVFGAVLLVVGNEIGESFGRAAGACGFGAAVGLCAGAAVGLEVGLFFGLLGGLAGSYLASSNTIPLVRRELASYFYSPIACMVMVGFLVLSGIIFSGNFSPRMPHVAEMRAAFDWISFLNIFVIPLMTMRLLAEENRSGTIEVLMTAPVSDLEVVLSKFLGAVIFYAAMLVPTFFYVATLFWLSSEGGPDMGAVWSGYLGLLLMASIFLAGGLMISSFCSDQIVAAVLSLVLVVGFFLVSFLYGFAEGSPRLQAIVEYAMVTTHYNSFRKGLIDSRDIVYFVSITAFFLFATVKSVESRKWR